MEGWPAEVGSTREGKVSPRIMLDLRSQVGFLTDSHCPWTGTAKSAAKRAPVFGHGRSRRALCRGRGDRRMNPESSSESNTKFVWRSVDRADAPKRAVAERVADFLEVYSDLDEQTAREQAARCVQCPNPNCVTDCPMANRIPEWLALTAEGHFLEAAELLVVGSSMPEIFCRICTQERQCEANCILGGPSEPVPIGAIERFLQEYALKQGVLGVTPEPPNGYRVAVVGSGPGGLICAEDLIRLGYAVTVFEASSVPGGLLISGLPAFKLPKSVVERRIELLRKRGVDFRLGVRVCVDVSLADLRQEFDAVFLAIGARQARPLLIPGSALRGVHPAVPFIVQKSAASPGDAPRIDATGKRVVVLGGGDTAMDCLRTAIRCGALDALCLYRRDESSLPATRKHYQNAREEGARFEFQVQPVAVLGDANGHVTHLRCVRTEPGEPDADGRRPAVARAGSEFDIPADLVVVAFGFDRAPCPPGSDFAELTRGSNGELALDERQMTSHAGVFAGGDLVHGPGRLVDTVRDARKAAKAIHAYLSGHACV
jgi:glutamate synthase (NADPH) small chain